MAQDKLEAHPWLSSIAKGLYSVVSPKKVPPATVTGLRVTTLGPTTLTLVWVAPAKGTPPIRYTVFFKRKSDQWWSVGATTPSLTASLTKLIPKTTYDLEVMASNN